MSRHEYRTVFISDTHLGSRGCQAEELAAFLDRVQCDTLYLVGDFIDFWNLRGRTYWPDTCNVILRRLLLMVEEGTRVIFIPGNHDEAARPYVGFQFGGVEIKMDDVHETADGRRLFITHGDLYDMVVKNFRLLSMVGGFAYETLIRVNRWYNTWRRWRGLPKSSFSQTIKLKVKGACKFISAFEETLKREAAERGFHGVVCGHVHKPELRERTEEGVQYFNCGDWIEHCSALVEHHNGSMELIYAADVLAAPAPAPLVEKPAIGSPVRRPGRTPAVPVPAIVAANVPGRFAAGAASLGGVNAAHVPVHRDRGFVRPAAAAAIAAVTPTASVVATSVSINGPMSANGHAAARHAIHAMASSVDATAGARPSSAVVSTEQRGDNAFHLEDWMANMPVTAPDGSPLAVASGRHVMTVADMFDTLTSTSTSSIAAAIAHAGHGIGYANGHGHGSTNGNGHGHSNGSGVASNGHSHGHAAAANGHAHGGNGHGNGAAARATRVHRRWAEDDEHERELAHVW